MRFNQAELAALLSNPFIEFEKEGLLIITEKQESFFRKGEINFPRWCKLRGNLLFYLKDQTPLSPPVGLLVLENCRPVIKNEEREFDGFAFILEFQDNSSQRISTRTAKERLEWVKSIQLSSYLYLNRQIQYLEDQISSATADAANMGNRIECGLPISTSNSGNEPFNAICELADNTDDSSTNQYEKDIFEIPLCELGLSCDNLPCATNGRPPNPRIVCSICLPNKSNLWLDYAQTEFVENSTNPSFLCTMNFYKSAGINSNTLLRFTVYDVREKLSATSLTIGYVDISFAVIQDPTRLHLPLRSLQGNGGFLTISSWTADATDRYLLPPPPPRSSTQEFQPAVKQHRRSHSLPCKFCVRLAVPYYSNIQSVFANARIHTYRLPSIMNGDISVQETMMESKLCFYIPMQLLSIWILREKELLQEISGMGELGGEWRQRQIDLLDKHLKYLKDYSQAKQNIQQLIKQVGEYFKKSTMKGNKQFEFIPVNLHLQRLWMKSLTLQKSALLDVITVGAFTKHFKQKPYRSGGLIKLLQEAKPSPSRSAVNSSSNCKVQTADDAVQAVKQLRKEVVDIMSQLLHLASIKNPTDMMSLCNELISKTKSLLNLCEPTLVEEAFNFIEKHRVLKEAENPSVPMSPFRKITQQLDNLDLKSPYLEDFATPTTAVPSNLWHQKQVSDISSSNLLRTNSLNQLSTNSNSSLDLKTIRTLQESIRAYNQQLNYDHVATKSDQNNKYNNSFQSLPLNLNISIEYPLEPEEKPNDPTEELRFPNKINLLDNVTTSFLNTHAMNNSPSANYYRPTEEPEPLDLTQLNIEASVMCLVSKIKFLCGRTGSPAIRLRQPKILNRRIGFDRNESLINHQDNQNRSNILIDLEANGNTIPLKNKSIKHPCDTFTNTSENNCNLDLNIVNSINSNQVKKKINKFTDGLDLALTTDWVLELRPSMRKLRHAMDGLLKTARLIHSVQRLQQDINLIALNLETVYRRDVCLSQALTSLITGLMAKLWGTDVTEDFINLLIHLGPLAYFEGLLSIYGNEIDMWGDMCIAIEDLAAVNFTLVPSKIKSNDPKSVPIPLITGLGCSLNVCLPVTEYVYSLLPENQTVSFTVTPVFFNIGINEKATLAETLGQTHQQQRSNWDNFLRLKQYYSRFRKLPIPLSSEASIETNTRSANLQNLENRFQMLESELKQKTLGKNVKILHLVEDVCHLMSGLRFTSCKSAKDRTGMAVTLEQYRFLQQEFQLDSNARNLVLSAMRSEGTRMDNIQKNIDIRRYAFNLPQVLCLPAIYRPPHGSYGKAPT